MDESSEFQEKKQSYIGPKKSENKVKSKKPIKRIKGQRDIKTALKLKKNDLLTYSKDFDNECKKLGVDIDSEQLQLAIALSKSLQTQSSCDSTGPESTPATNTQGRIGKIRTTLQEYGFSVPQLKISGTKRLKKFRKDYKLLKITESERQQVISDKYSQVLFQNICTLNESSIDNKLAEFDRKLCYKTTSVPFSVIKSDDIYYVSGLLERPPNSLGSMLRDWSEIPGRPVTPNLCEDIKMNFSEIDCSQDELDVVLSGTIKSAKELLGSKYNFYKKDVNTIEVVDKDNVSKTLSVIPNEVMTVVATEMKEYTDNNTSPTAVCCESKNLLSATQNIRSCSPDIFDDEVVDEDLQIINNTNKKEDIVDQEISKIITAKSQDFMDLTECVNVVSHSFPPNVRSSLISSQLSQKSNVTKRKSDDFMEITECVAGSSQPLFVHDTIDLTQCTSKDIVIIKDNGKPGHIELDLTQSSNSSDDLPSVHISSRDKIIDDTIILANDDLNSIHNHSKNDFNNLTEEIEFVDNVVHNSDTTINTCEDRKTSEGGIFEDYEHNHSDEEITENDNSNNNANDDETIEPLEVDLTQSSEADNEFKVENSINTSQNRENLGKIDNVSIDYDEIFDNLDKNSEISAGQSNASLSRSVNADVRNSDSCKTNEYSSNLSQQSEIFEICDNELNYSMQQSRLEDYGHVDFGGISVIDDIVDQENSATKRTESIKRCSNNYNNLTNRPSLRDSFLPEVNIRNEKLNSLNTEEVSKKSEVQNKVETMTPDKRPILLAKTPLNNEYIVKMDQVTPMQDYASMSSPEMNKELDKYGIKPFKRKRAIQLLTYLYNQTHPIVESCPEASSPSKKPRQESPNKSKSSKRLASTSKTVSNAMNVGRLELFENYINAELDTPVVKEIDCAEEDWVFQKREKAKIASCRVPLHIALHNYVSSRPRLRAAILRYEPINIDDIHRDLVQAGHRYDPKELLKFLDKKCITVKTMENNARNKR